MLCTQQTNIHDYSRYVSHCGALPRTEPAPCTISGNEVQTAGGSPQPQPGPQEAETQGGLVCRGSRGSPVEPACGGEGSGTGRGSRWAVMLVA